MKICTVCQRCYDDSALLCDEAGHHDLFVLVDRSRLMIPGYSLEYLTARDGSTQTYVAQRIDGGRDCSIKVVSADAERREQFLCDAMSAAGMFNPFAADVYEAGSLETGDAFVVADADRHDTLRSFIQVHGAPELLTCIQVVRQCAEALHALHAGGLTHGAVRPESIAYDPQAPDGDQIKLQNIDFGGAAEFAILSDKFTIDDAVDRLRYFAPEQFSGVPASVRSDIYSLGVVFYEMLSGHAPFQSARAADLIEMHRSQAPPEVRIDDLDLRMLIGHALSESLQKRPDVRQSSANTFARQLRHIEQLATHISTPPPAVVLPKPVRVPLRITDSPRVSLNVERPNASSVMTERMVPADCELHSPPLENAAPLAAADHQSRLRSHRRRVHTRTRPENAKPLEPQVAQAHSETQETKKIAAVPLAVLRYAARENAEQTRSAQARQSAVSCANARPYVRSTGSSVAESPDDFFPEFIDHEEVRATILPEDRVVLRGFPAAAYRWVFAGFGLLAAVVLSAMWIGNSPGSADPNDSAAGIAETQKPPPRQQEIRTAAAENVSAYEQSASAIPLPVPAEETARALAAPRVERSPAGRSVSTKPTAEAGSKQRILEPTKAAATAQTRVKTPSVSSTLIIYSENGKVKSRSEPADRSGATRPRIVKNPKS